MASPAFQAAQEVQQISLIPDLPAVIPPTTRLNFLRNWWQRSERTSVIAEARLMQRVHHNATLLSDNPVPLLGMLLRVPLDKDSENPELGPKKQKLVNTFYLTKQPQQKEPFVLKTEKSLSDINNTQTADTKNLVICHGYGAGLGFFYRNYHALAQIPGLRVFGIDWLGMGRSSRPKWTIFRKSKQTWDDIIDEVEDHFVESLEDWRKKVGLNKMTLMGHSLGGYFSVCYALKYPERVEKLVLVSPAGVGPRPPEVPAPETPANETPEETINKEASEIQATMQAQVEEQSVSPPRVARKIPTWAKVLWDSHVTPMSVVRATGPFGASLVNSYTSRRFAHLETAEQHDLYDYLYHITSSSGSGEYALAAILSPGAYARRPLMDRLAKLTMPTLFVYGDQDWMDYKSAEKAQKNMKVPTKIIRIPYGGHHMYLDNPDAFNEVMVKELSEESGESA